MPTLLLAPGVVTVRLFDRERMRGSVSRDSGRRDPLPRAD